MNITKLIDNVNLHQPDRGWSLQRGSTVRPSVTHRRSVVSVPRSHGSRASGRAPVFDEPTVTLEWLVRGTSQTELEAAWSGLAGLLATGQVYQHEADSVTTAAPMVLVSISEPGDFAVERLMRMTAIVALPGVFLRGQGYITTATLAAGAHDLTDWGCSAPIPDPVIRFTGPVATVSVTDTTYGEGVSWAGAVGDIPAGTYLYLAPASWQAWSSSSATAWEPTGTNRTKGMSHPAVGRLQLQPRTVLSDPVSRKSTVTVTGGSCVIRARGAWL